MLINLSVKYKSPFFFCFVFLVRIVSDQSAQIGERLIEDYLNEQAEKDSRSFSLSNQVFNRSSTDNEESVQLSASIGGSQLDTFADINMFFDKVIYFNLIHLEYFESIMLNSLDSELRRTASWRMSTLLH